MKKIELFINNYKTWNGNMFYKKQLANEDMGIVITNGYSFVRLYNVADVTGEEMSNSMFEMLCKKDEDIYSKSLDVPSVAEIKESIISLTGRKYSQRVLYCFGKDLPIVNANYLYRLLDIINATEIKWEGRLKPLRINGVNGYAILLPMHSPINEYGYYVK